jgi:alpha-1,3-mannosyltransferase
MAKNTAENETTIEVSYLRQLKDLAMGEHPLSRFVPPLLLLADAVFTGAVIYTVSCKLFLILIVRPITN